MRLSSRWLIFLPLVIVLLFALSGLALGQGPVLTTLPTPTPAPFVADTTYATDIGPQADLPDLIVEKIEVSPTTPLVGQSTVISVTIKNNGPGYVPIYNNFLTDLYIDPPIEPIPGYHQIEDPSLGLPWGAQWFYVAAPGASYVFTTVWVFDDVKTFDIWAQVDSGGDSTEQNEYNNTKKIGVSVITEDYFHHDSHQDFSTSMASTLDNSDANGALRLGLFSEPPIFHRPFTNPSCEINPGTVTITDYNMESPDTRINQTATGSQVQPHLVTNGNGAVIAVWQDGRNGEINNRDIYLRYSTDEGENWGTEERVNDDSPSNHANQLNPVAALSENGNLLVAWQDYRNGLDYDIYAQRFVISGTTLIRSGSNVLVGGPGGHTVGDQKVPDIAVDEGGGFHVVWQHSWNNNDDIYATSYIPNGGGYAWSLVRQVNDPNSKAQQSPTIQVLDWLEPTSVTYTVAPTEPYTVTVTGVISQAAKILVVTWEDYRFDDVNMADIAMTLSTDGGETFDVDRFITQSSTDGTQENPDVTLTKSTATIPFTVQLPDASETMVEVEVPASDIHTVWEGYSTLDNLDRDIYYNKSQLKVEQVSSGNDFRHKLTIGNNEKVNQNDTRDWQTGPVDQSGPGLVASPCGEDANDPEGWNLFITWADGRNYDSWNYDIYFTAKSSCAGMPDGLGANQMLNDGIRLHNFNATNPSYDDYDAGSPPPGHQVSPSVAADIWTDWPFVLSGYLYLAWEDDRAGDPQTQHDIYFSRSNLTYFNQESSFDGFRFGAGSHISDILDSGAEGTTWYTIKWTASTPSSTYVTVQTRLGDTIAEVLASEWYPRRFPYQPQDCDANNSGAPLPGYNGPGQHIEDAAENFWPKARYIQYRVNFYTRDSTHTPELDDLTIYYGRRIYHVFLPLVLK